MLSSKNINASIVFFLAATLSLSACTKTREGRMKKDSAPTAGPSDDKLIPPSADELAKQAQAAAAEQAAADVKSNQDLCALPADMKIGKTVMNAETVAKEISGNYQAEKILVFQSVLDNSDSVRKLLKTLVTESKIENSGGETKASAAITCVKTNSNEVTRLTRTEIAVSQIPSILHFNGEKDERLNVVAMNLSVLEEKSSGEAKILLAEQDQNSLASDSLKNMSLGESSSAEFQRFELSEDKQTLKVSFAMMQDNQEQLQQGYKDVTSVTILYKKVASQTEAASK